MGKQDESACVEMNDRLKGHFGNDMQKIQQWTLTPHKELGGHSPMEMIARGEGEYVAKYASKKLK